MEEKFLSLRTTQGWSGEGLLRLTLDLAVDTEALERDSLRPARGGR